MPDTSKTRTELRLLLEHVASLGGAVTNEDVEDFCDACLEHLPGLLAALDQQSADAELATRLRQERDHYREQYLNLQADAELGRLLREAIAVGEQEGVDTITIDLDSGGRVDVEMLKPLDEGGYRCVRSGAGDILGALRALMGVDGA